MGINRLMPRDTGQKIVATGTFVVDKSNWTISGNFTYTSMVNKKSTQVVALIVNGKYLPGNSIEWEWSNPGHGASKFTAKVAPGGKIVTGMSRRLNGGNWVEASHTYTRKG